MKETLVWLLFVWSGNTYVPQPIYFASEKACKESTDVLAIVTNTNVLTPALAYCKQMKVLLPKGTPQ